MSITIDFTAPTESDIASANLYESDSANGTYSLVYNEAITVASTSITYSSGSETKWYKISFVDDAGLESQLSIAIYGSGSLWYNYMISAFRTEVGDWGTSPKYTDLDIRKKLVISGSKLQSMGLMYDVFAYQYSFAIDSGDGSGWSILPDPVYVSKDENFLLLWLYKTVCDDYKTSLSSATTNAIKIKDGDSSIDTTAGFGGYKTLLESDSSPCKIFENMWKQLIFVKNGTGSQGTGTTKKLLANYGSDFLHRPEVFNINGGIDRSV